MTLWDTPTQDTSENVFSQSELSHEDDDDELQECASGNNKESSPAIINIQPHTYHPFKILGTLVHSVVMLQEWIRRDY